MAYTQTYLRKKETKIIREGHYILTEKEPEDYPEQDTRLYYDQILLNEEELKPYSISYERLHSQFKFKVCRNNFFDPETNKRWSTLDIRRTNLKGRDLKEIPNKHYVEFDPLNMRLRLVGELSFKGWINCKAEYKKDKKDEPNGNPFFKSKKQDKEYHIIKEIPIGYSVDGELVCLKRTMDPDRIGIVGEPGTGKTTWIHAYQDRLIEEGQTSVIGINDLKNETGEYAFPWYEDSPFIPELQKLNQIPKPMPMVYLHPTNDRLMDHKGKFDELEMLHPFTLGFPINIPFKEAMENVEDVLEIYPLQKSENYLRIVIDELKECKSWEEIEQVVETIPKGSRLKIRLWLKKLYDAKIFDISHNSKPTWTVKKKDEVYIEYPWTAALISGLSVSVVTKHIIHYDYYPLVLKFIMDNLFETKTRHPELKDKNLAFFVDESPELMDNPKSKKTISRAIAVMRSEGIGGGISTQYYEDIPPKIRNNLSHMAIFRTRIDKNLKEEWLKGFPEFLKSTHNLKKFECIMCGDLVLYKGKEKYSNDRRPIRMKIIPPTSQHHAPPQAR